MKKIKNGYNNIKYEIIYFILTFIISFVTRKLVVNLIGVEVVALNYILNQIVNFMALIEFGVHNILVFNLYGALKENDIEKINSIMSTFKFFYRFIAISIFILGICFIPFLKFFINEYTLSINYIIIYLLVLFQISFTFLFSYKPFLLQADQKSYLYLKKMVNFKFLSSIIEIFVLIYFKNYYLYFALYVISTLFMHYLVSRYVDKKYSYLSLKKKDSIKFFNVVKENIKNTAVSKICWVLNESIDAFILGIFSTVLMVGLYSNYYVLISTIYYVIRKIYEAIQAIIANKIIDKEGKEELYFVNFSTYLIGFVCSLGFYLLADFVIKIWLGSEFLLSKDIVLALSIQLFLIIYRISLWQFTSIKGWFNINKISDLIGIVVNIILSVVLYFKVGILGIIIGTVVSQLIQYFIEGYMICNKFKNFNLILKSIVLIGTYLLIILTIRKFLILSIILIITVILYFVIYLKRSWSYVFRDKKII